MKHDTGNVVIVDIKVRKENEFVTIAICDRGVGLDNDSKKILLNRLDSGVKAGSGMGLTLVKRIVERYKGKIVIEDRVKGNHIQGTCFILYIPVK